MQITLQVVRDVLRSSLGHDSFIASFIKRVEECPDCPTACITAEGHLQYGKKFVEEFVASGEDLFCLIMHELMHPMFGHFVHGTGQLENIAADMVINACISQLFSVPSGKGSLFTRVYGPSGIEGLLRPDSQMSGSRYNQLYRSFYWSGSRSCSKLSTGEVIQSLKVLTAPTNIPQILLLGSHDALDGKTVPNTLPSEVLSRIASDLQKSVVWNKYGGVGQDLYDLFVEVIKTQLSMKRLLLERFLSKQKADRFFKSMQHPRSSVSPIPLRPSKRDLVLLAADMIPLQYRNQIQATRVAQQGLAVYLDVSGSVNQHLPKLLGLLQHLQCELQTVFLFSNAVVETPVKQLLTGKIKTTHGTDFNCIAQSILDGGFDKAVILTDGFASLKPELQEDLKRKKVRTMTVLFGGKVDCKEFAATGDVVQLSDITQ